MDQDQQEQQRHVCKFCFKNFSSGKILGGHMRCHVVKNSKKPVKKRPEAENSKSYGLRVNPKKSSRVSSPHSDRSPLSLSSTVETPCGVCGKVFDSMRALFGHMRHHSSKRKRETSPAMKSDEGLIGESLFIESSGFARRKRSRRSWNKVSSSGLTTSFTVSNSSVELDPDLDEIAECLLLLSKGVQISNELCIDDYDDEKVICEDFLGDKKLPAFNEEDKESVSVSLEASDPKGIDLICFEKESDHLETGFDDQDCIGQSSWSLRKIEYKCRTCDKSFHSHQALGGHQTIHRPNKAYLVGSQFGDFPEIEAKLSNNNNSEELVVEYEAEKLITMTSCETSASANKEHKCPICFKVFASGQALGGHKRAHVVKDSEIEADQIALVSHGIYGIHESQWWVKNSHNKHEILVGLVPN